jgi:5-hydroxyisourate hydrolase-like protein (transthyretin family)
MAVADKKNGRIEIQKEQYKDAVQSISWLQASVGDTLAVSLKIVPVSAPATLQPVQSPVIIQIQGRIVDSLTGQPVKGASLRMYNLTSRKIREVDVDATGRFSIALFSGQEYEWLVKTAQQEWQVEYSTKSETMANTLHIEVMCGQKAFIRTSLQDKP